MAQDGAVTQSEGYHPTGRYDQHERNGERILDVDVPERQPRAVPTPRFPRSGRYPGEGSRGEAQDTVPLGTRLVRVLRILGPTVPVRDGTSESARSIVERGEVDTEGLRVVGTRRGQPVRRRLHRGRRHAGILHAPILHIVGQPRNEVDFGRCLPGTLLGCHRSLDAVSIVARSSRTNGRLLRA